ncbi:MAG TPA: hypothetical protein VN604_01115, partial [Nitrospirota bacterium]|nr:hypothetical protein [Nitrospirota bacterium]
MLTGTSRILGTTILSLLLCFPAHADERTPAASSPPPQGQRAEDQTTFLIDRFAEAAVGTEWSERRLLLIEYAASDPAAEIILRNLPSGTDRVAQTSARAKAALVLHLLKKTAGDARFAAAQKDLIGMAKLRPITWDDVRTVIEQQTGADLAGFFRQWVDGKGLPDLRVEKAAVLRKGGGYETSFDIVQAGTPFELEVPVTVLLTGGGVKKETVS